MCRLAKIRNEQNSDHAQLMRKIQFRSSFNITKHHIKTLLEDLLAEMRGLKYHTVFQITFRKDIENDETKCSPPIYFNSNAQIVINEFDINDQIT